jgi:hypothetical protein
VSLPVIGLAVLLLASFVFAFLGARTWHWGHVIVVMGIFLSTLGFFILLAEIVRINKVLQTDFQRAETSLNDMKARNVALRKGTNNTTIIAAMQNEDPPLTAPENAESIPGITQLDHDLLLQTRVRGRVWRGAKRTGDINPQTGAMTIGFEGSAPPPLPKDTVVYLFEDGAPQLPAADGAPRGAQFLGEFRVTGQPAQLTPARPMDDFERKRLAASRLPWIIYETMPIDRHEIFAGKPEAELKQKLPPTSVTEYLRDGQDATADDDPARQVGYDAEGNRLPPDKLTDAVKKKYSRRLRDYAVEFETLARQRVALEAKIAATTNDIARLKTAEQSAKQLQAFRQEEKARLTTELAGITKERVTMQKHLAQIEAQLARVNQLLAETLRRNSQIVRELSGRSSPARRPANGAASPPQPAAGPLALGNG